MKYDYVCVIIYYLPGSRRPFRGTRTRALRPRIRQTHETDARAPDSAPGAVRAGRSRDADAVPAPLPRGVPPAVARAGRGDPSPRDDVAARPISLDDCGPRPCL